MDTLLHSRNKCCCCQSPTSDIMSGNVWSSSLSLFPLPFIPSQCEKETNQEKCRLSPKVSLTSAKRGFQPKRKKSVAREARDFLCLPLLDPILACVHRQSTGKDDGVKKTIAYFLLSLVCLLFSSSYESWIRSITSLFPVSSDYLFAAWTPLFRLSFD